jgi:hypothetical protein
VRHHKIEADELAGLIVEVHRALASLGRVQEPAKPAVPIRRSVQQDYVVCPSAGFARRCLAPPSAVARPRSRRLPHPLGTTGELSSHRTELFGAALGRGQGDRFRAPPCRRETEPAGNRAASDPAWRSPTEAPADDITPTVLRALPVNLCYRFYIYEPARGERRRPNPPEHVP